VILQQMACAPEMDVLFNAMITSGFGQLTQTLVASKLGPVILSTSVAILRAANIAVQSSYTTGVVDGDEIGVAAKRHHLRRGAVMVYRIAPILSILISLPIMLMIAQYIDKPLMKCLVLFFWLAPLASAQMYSGRKTTDTIYNYILTVWLLYTGTLMLLILYVASLHYGNIFDLVKHMLQLPDFWWWLVQEIAEVLIALRVLGQFIYSGLHIDDAHTSGDDNGY
jgi:hypothetical protein